MRKIERLKKEAKEAAEGRGHTLAKWVHYGLDRRGFAMTVCKNENCRGQIVAEPWPLPNGIEIGGELVAMNCPSVNRFEGFEKQNGKPVCCGVEMDLIEPPEDMRGDRGPAYWFCLTCDAEKPYGESGS